MADEKLAYTKETSADEAGGQVTPILLQGKEVILTDVIKTLNLDDIMTDDILVDLVNVGITIVGRPLEGLGEVDPFHITRILKRKGHKNVYKPEEISPDPGNMFVLISASAGMGKSRMISRMRGEEFYWKYRINLQEHCAILNNRNNMDTLDFLREAKKMSKAEYTFFKVAYEIGGSIVLFFDGFDELAPEYKRIVLELFMSLKTSKVSQVWVTTSPAFEEELEKELDTIAYQLEPFSLDDQKMFLKKIWNTSDESEVDDHLNKFSKAIRDSVNFTSIPLHLKIISDMRSESIFNKDLNMFSIYDQFFKIKFYQVAMREKAGMDLNISMLKDTVDDRYVTIKRKYQKMAILALFEKSEITNLISLDEMNEFDSLMIAEISQGKKNCGIVQTIINDRPVFTHRTFAEFFAASWLVKYYIKYKYTKDFSKIKIYQSIHSPENNVLKLFCDFSLCIDSEACRAVLTRDLDKLNNMTLKSLKKKDLAGRTAYHLAKAYEYYDICKIISYKLADVFMNDQLFYYNPMQYQYFQTSSVWSSRDIYLKYKQTNEDEKKLENCRRKIKLHWGAANGLVSVVEDLIENGADVNASDEYKVTPLHLAAANGLIEIMTQLIKSGARLNEKDYCGMTPFHAAVMFEKDEAIKILIENKADLDIRENDGFTPLHRTAIKGDRDLTTFLLENGSNPNVKSERGLTPLYLAALVGHLDIVQTLIERGADPHIPENNLMSPLYIAAQNGYNEVVRLLIQRGVDVNSTARNGKFPLHISVENGHLDVTQILIDNGANMYEERIKGITLLHVAAEHGHNDLVLYLIDQGADLDIEDEQGETPLHLAAENNHLEVLKTLIDHGADMSATTIKERTLLHIAAEKGHKDIVQYLLDQGADLDIKDKDGGTALQWAVVSNRLEVMKILIYHGADTSVTTNMGHTLLHIAVNCGSKDVVLYLMDQGVDLEVKDEDGETTLHLAAENNDLEVLHSLIERGADMRATTNMGHTPLHVAAEHGHNDVVLYLMDQGVDLEVKDEDGKTALHTATKNNHLEVLKTLIDRGADMSATTNKGQTPFEIAVENDYKNVKQYLIRKNQINKRKSKINSFPCK